MNGVTVTAQQPLEFANTADVVLFGSGILTRDITKDESTFNRLKLNPKRQLIGAQCSGILLLATLGYLDGLAACTDLTIKPWVVDAGVKVLNQPFYANGNIATAGGCLASTYLAAWIIARTEGIEAAKSAIHYIAPVGEKESYVTNAINNIKPYLQD